MIAKEEHVSLTMVARKHKKEIFPVTEHEFYKYVYHSKNWVYWLSTRREKMLQPLNIHFEKKGPEVKK